ncbi:MAG: 5-formyltetrahydrofolate cyclo-ligase [Candidatus Tantalella remota]|nr:5-formyltetrahydrofolate cyclo-ligase [Candidatus Tantalella remota]
MRKGITEKLRDQTPDLREQRSRRIQETLVSSAEFRKAGTVMSYVATDTEVDTAYLNEKVLEAGKKLVVPVIDAKHQITIASELKSIKDLVKGPYGIYEPKDGLMKQTAVEDIDLIVAPAIAYDRQNMRLGRGKGYYDKFFAGAPLRDTVTVGLAFHFQVVDFLPTDPHDKAVSKVITDKISPEN